MKTNSIRLFMWGYQRHFQINVKVAAETLFGKLDRKLFPQVFLIGVLFEDRTDRYPICLEPEDCGYSPELFSNVKELANALEEADEESQIWHSHPIAEMRHKKWIKDKSLMNATEHILNEADKDYVSFCSLPQLLEGYMVCVVLQFQRKVLANHYSLRKSMVEQRYKVATSLFDATITEYLRECAEALTKPEPGLSAVSRDFDEVIRSAGRELMHTPVWACKHINWGLFDTLNAISALKYEGAEGIGSMLVAQRGHPNVETVIELSAPIRLRNYRAVRKLLEISSDTLCLLSDSASVYGLGHVKGEYDAEAENLFRMNFTKHFTWNLAHADHMMMRAVYGQPQLPTTEIDSSKLKSDLRRIFTGIKDGDIENLHQLLTEATRQKRGTMLVVSPSAQDEAERLETQCTKITPISLTAELVTAVTSIDGAVLIDPHGTCYAIGVILDGLASKKGTPSRGARYNSAIRYQDGKRNCLVVIVSEDGTIDLLPDLMPQIDRVLLREAISALEQITGSETIDERNYNQVIGWLLQHRFYLLPEICDQLNKLKKEIGERLKRDDPTGLRIIYDDFAPDEDMNESYFL